MIIAIIIVIVIVAIVIIAGQVVIVVITLGDRGGRGWRLLIVASLGAGFAQQGEGEQGDQKEGAE